MKMKKNVLLVMTMMTMAGGLVLSACSEYDTASGSHQNPQGIISFSASQGTTTDVTRSQSATMEPLPLSGYTKELWLLPEAQPMAVNLPATRGTQLTSESVLTDFGVSAYKTSQEKGNLEGRTPDYFYNLQAIRVGETSTYTISQDYYWPSNDERLWFYAYYPYNGSNSVANGDNLNVVLSPQTQTGPQTIDYTVAENVTDQVDLMTARTGQTDAFLTQESPRVDLAFEHQLTGIRFKVGSQFPTKGYIQSIQLLNVYKHGVYTIGNGWSHEDGDRGNFTVTYEAEEKMTGTVGQMITDDDEVFLMIPTTFTAEDDAKIVVKFWDGAETHTVEASLTGTTWAAGETVTYSLSSEKLTTLKIKSITFAETVSGAPYTSWQNGDQVGLYVVADGQNGGTDLRYKNVQCTYNNGAWTVGTATVKDAVTNKDIQVTPIMYPGDNYYFYYPYAAGEPAGKPSAANGADATADAFWSSVITAHNVQTDQSTPASFKQSDLQVAKAVLPANSNDLASSTISATMSRKVGLAIITIGTKSANKSVTFNNGVAGTPTKGDVTATSTFVAGGNTPFLNGTKFYYYTKAGVATSFNSSPTEKEAWHEALEFTIPAGNSQELTAYSDRAYWDYIDAVWNYSYTTDNYYKLTAAPQGSYTYTLQVWGAQGGTVTQIIGTRTGGYGAYATGKVRLDASEPIYVMVGQEGIPVTSGTCTSYPNGGRAWLGNSTPAFSKASIGEQRSNAGSGGGSTSIATVSSLPKDMKDNYAEVLLILAGGGGAGTMHSYDQKEWNWSGNGGNAGGIQGNNGTAVDSDYTPGGGGTQTSGGLGGWQGRREIFDGAFGIGSDGRESCTGGGGGFYGGGGSWGSGGGGGSSYIGNSRLTDKYMLGYSVKTSTVASTYTKSVAKVSSTPTADYAKSGAGYARITLTRW